MTIVNEWWRMVHGDGKKRHDEGVVGVPCCKGVYPIPSTAQKTCAREESSEDQCFPPNNRANGILTPTNGPNQRLKVSFVHVWVLQGSMKWLWFLGLLGYVASVDRGNFKTCSQSGFCK